MQTLQTKLKQNSQATIKQQTTTQNPTMQALQTKPQSCNQCSQATIEHKKTKQIKQRKHCPQN